MMVTATLIPTETREAFHAGQHASTAEALIVVVALLLVAAFLLGLSRS